MRQYFRFFDDLIDSIFLKIELDVDIITVKAFHMIFRDGLPEDTNNLKIIEDPSQTNVLTLHNIEIQDTEIQDIISGNLFDSVGTQGFYFKFFGGAQILRATTVSDLGQPEGGNYVSIRTSVFDKGYGRNIGYNTNLFNEWTDCSLWGFDFNFEGMNWMYPKNILFDSYLNKAPHTRSEFYENTIKAPQLVRIQNETPFYTSGETKKRLLSMFIYDKDDSFLDSSFYAKINGELGLDFTIGEDIQPAEKWKFSYPLLRNYTELPIYKIQLNTPFEMSVNEMAKIDVYLYDDEFYLKTENDDHLYNDNIESYFVLEEGAIEDLYYDYYSTTKKAGTVKEKYIVNKDLDLYISVSGGYLNKHKISVKNGIGYFNFRALDLEAGDEVVIKIGFKAFSNVASRKIKIVN